MEFIQRQILPKIISWLDKPEIVVVSGARQVGKTVLLGQIKDYLLSKKGISENAVRYVNFDDSTLRNRAKENPAGFLRSLIGNEVSLVFIDEFQKVPEIVEGLKIIYDDSKTRIKFFLSGSAHLALSKTVSESLLGRFVKFTLCPFSFQEFLLAKKAQKECFVEAQKELEQLFTATPNFSLKKLQSILLLEQGSISSLFYDFLNLGGYPRSVLANDFSESLEIRRSIKTAYLERDIQILLKEEQLFAFEKLMEILAHRIGNLISFQELAALLTVSLRTVKELWSILVYTYIIEHLYPLAYFGNEYKKSPKVYFTDLGLRNALISAMPIPYDPQVLGPILENTVFNVLAQFAEYKSFYAKVNFWRTYGGSEVDFVLARNGKKIGIEVKNKSFGEAKVPRGVQEFISRYKPNLFIVVNKDFFGEEKFNQTKVVFLPAWAFALLI